MRLSMRRAGAGFTALLLMQSAPASARWMHTLAHVFNGPDGANPVGGLIADPGGNIYGVSHSGGAFGDGTVFQLRPPVSGKIKWSETVLHAFDHAAGDGAFPTASLVRDADGNLYGTTAAGGSGLNGTVFKLTPGKPGAGWHETVLYSFSASGGDGSYPAGQLLMDAQGRLFGTTFQGGTAGFGTVFELTPPAGAHAAWSESVLHSFGGTDGSGPMGSLAADSAGNLFGTTENGGTSNDGAVFELAAPAPGQTEWTPSVVMSFSYEAGNGVAPLSGVVFDSAGDLIGTTYAGGKHGAGAVFMLLAPAAGRKRWHESLLYSFIYKAPRGAFPATGVSFDAAGNLYGTTQGGGTNNAGTLFQLAPPAAGKAAWNETVLHSFRAAAGNGEAPNGTVVPDGSGGVFGTTYDGGKYGDGTVFKLSP